MSSKRFKGITSISDMLGWQTSSFNEFLKIDSSGISKYTMEEIRAKSAVLGLTDELTAQAVALAKDADFTAKAATGKLTWGKALADAGDDVEDIGKILLNSGKLTDDWQTRLTNAFNSDNKNNLKQNIMDAINSVDGLSDSFIDLGNAGKTAGTSLSDYFIGLYATIKPLLPLMIAVGSAFAAYKIWDMINLSYDEARDNLNTTSSNYQETTSELESLNSELETTTTRIEELKALQSQGTISMTEEAELAKLERQNESLQKQLDIKQKLADIQQREQFEAVKTVLDYKNEEIYKTDKNGNVVTTNDGMVVMEQVNRFDYLEEQMRRYNQAKKNVASAQEAFSKAETDYANGDITKKQFEQFRKNLENNEKAVSDYESTISSGINELGSDIKQLYDANGNIIKGGEEYVKRFNDITDSFNNIDLSPAEKALNSLNNYFDGSVGKNAIKEQLKDAVESGRDLETELNRMGLSLEDLGIENVSQLASYFKKTAEATNEANKSVQDYAATVEDVTGAKESANKDQSWTTISEAYKTAKQLLAEGKTGVDDFQTVASFLNPQAVKKYAEEGGKYTADAYQKAFEEVRATANRWFGEDEAVSMKRFVNDFKNKGLFNVTTDSKGLWDIEKNFKTSAEAADKFGISVEAVETMLNGLEAYGYDFSDVIFSTEGIKEYENTLNGIKDIYDSLQEGSAKDRLGKLIEGWDSEFANYKNDLDSLSEEQIVRIKFEYDLASIQQKIDELQATANEGGDTQTWAELNAAKRSYREKSESRDKNGLKDVSEYKSVSDSIVALQDQMRGATAEQKVQIQEQISNLYDVQNALNDLFADSGKSWDEFIKTDEYKNAITDMLSSTDDAKQAIAELMGVDVKNIKIDVDTNINKDDIEKQLKEYSEGGNVDLTLRPVIDSSELINAGWDVPAGEAATVFSSTFSNELGNIAMNFTPIMTDENGNYMGVMSPEELQKYAEEVIAGVRDDDLNLKIGATYEGDDAIEQAVAAAEKIHELQEDYYINVEAKDNASDVINKVSQEEIEDKIVTLTGIDDATPYINLWNTMSADPKFTELSATDQATLVVKTYNALPIEDKQSLISQTGGDVTQGVANAVKSAIENIPNTKNISIGASITKGFYTAYNYVKNAIATLNKGMSTGGVGGYQGTAHYGGTAHVRGSIPSDVFTNPKYRTKDDEVTLTGEEDQEIVVHGNEWWTVGDKGAEFSYIPSNSIVFNGKQTKELLSKGYTNSRGKAHLHGTAYRLGNNTTSTATSKKASNSKSSNSSKSSSSSNSNASKTTEELYNFIEILLTRTKELTKKLTDAIEDAVSLSDKMSKNSSALSQIQKEISVNQQAYNKYIAQANNVGLAEGYASQIRNGSLNIENITDENLKKKIDQYKEYYDKAVSVQEAVRDLQKEEKQLALDRLDYIKDYYDAIENLNSAYRDVNDTRIELNNALGKSAVSDEIKLLLQSSYEKQQDSYNKALTQLSDYQNEFNELVRNNYIEEGSEAYLEGQATIQEFIKQVDEAAIALIELEDKIRDIDYKKLEQLIESSERRSEQLKNAQSLAEARDEQIGREDYQKQIDELSNNINQNYDLREQKLSEQALYDVGSDKYNELAKEISDIDNEIYDNLIEIEELKDKIFETEFINYEKEQENLAYFIDELNDFSSLLNEDAFFTKDGAFTDEAYAKIALTADAMSKCKQQIANATEALNKLDEMYQNGLISEEEYNEKQKELLNTVRENTLAVDDYKNELIDLYKKQMEKENEALKKNIELRKRALQAQKDYWDYADTINSKTKDVDALKAQIAALDGVTSSAGLARKKQLEAELANAEKDLSDTKRNHQYDMMQDGYDQMSENLDESLTDIEYSIATSSEKQLQVVQSMLNQMVASYQEAYGKINTIVNETCFVGTDSFNDTVNNTSTSSGASSITDNATQSQSTVKPSDNVSNINSSNTSNTNTSAIESEIKKEPNTDNRLCAELTLSKSSVSVQEGSSTSVSASIRPNDAKNKTISWSSANSSIASVSSEGKITGIKPGTTTITASTTDGSGLIQTCKVTVTKKPDPPKPQAPKNNTTTQGNGVPDVGDKVTFISGVYHEDSYGNGRWGNQGLGGSMYITKINPNSPYPIHLSTGSKLGSGDRGWLKRNQIKGYARGSKYIDRRQWAFMDDTENGSLDTGSEVIITNRGILKQFEAGDTIFNNEQVQRLWEMSKGLDMSRFINLNTSNVIGSLPNIVNRNEMSRKTEINMNFDTLMTIEGNVTKDALPGLEKAIDKMIPHISDKLAIYIKGDMRKL